MAGILCAVHCTLGSLVPGLVTALGLASLLGETTEWWLNGAAVILGGYAIYLNWRGQSPSWVIIGLGLSISGITLGRYLEHAGHHEAGSVVSIVSSLGLITSHALNLSRLHHQRPEAPVDL